MHKEHAESKGSKGEQRLKPPGGAKGAEQEKEYDRDYSPNDKVYEPMKLT
jgi:hypothetical protein